MRRASLLALLGLAAAGAPLAAQTASSTSNTKPAMVPGTWTGWAMTDNGEEIDLEFAVSMVSDSIRITMSVQDRGSFELQKIKLENNVLTFSFQPGPTFDCRLERSAYAGFRGECSANGEEHAVVEMTPPAEQ